MTYQVAKLQRVGAASVLIQVCKEEPPRDGGSTVSQDCLSTVLEAD